MNCIVKVIFLIILFTPLTAFGGERFLLSEPYNRYKPVHIKNDSKGNMWIVYHGAEGRILLKKADSEHELIVSDATADIAGGLVFDVQGDNIYIVWREKIGGKKNLLFRASYDNGKTLTEPIMLDVNETEALTRIKIGSNSKGDVHVLWYGERLVNDERYHIYCASSNDFGKTFSKPKNLTLGYRRSIYPALLVDESAAYIFSYSRKDDKIFMIFRKTLDGGNTWTEPMEIKEIGVVTLFIEPIKVKDRIHVLWFNSYAGIPIVEGAYSDDDGKTWKTYFLEDTRSLDIGVLKVSHDSDGNIYLAFFCSIEEGKKSNVYLIASNDNGTTWQKMVNLRKYPFNLTMALNPEIYASGKGEVVAVWVDYRNIRSNIYMQYSMDGGKTFQNKDIPLEEPGRFNTAFYPFTRNLLKINDTYYLLAYRFKNDNITQNADLLLIDLKLNSGGSK